jgi:hypothetical protein
MESRICTLHFTPIEFQFQQTILFHPERLVSLSVCNKDGEKGHLEKRLDLTNDKEKVLIAVHGHCEKALPDWSRIQITCGRYLPDL